MEKDNIEEMMEKKDMQEKMIFFFKNEPESTPDIDPDKAIYSRIQYDDPLQVLFLVGGEASISYNGGTRNEVMGMQTYLTDQRLWQNLFKEIIERSDSEIRRGCRIDMEYDEFHSFYLYGFKNKEEVLGLIQEKHKNWIEQVYRILEQSCPDSITEGDNQIKDQGVRRSE